MQLTSSANLNPSLWENVVRRHLRWDRVFVPKESWPRGQGKSLDYGSCCSWLSQMPVLVDFEWSCPSTSLSSKGRYHSALEEFEGSETNECSSKEEMVWLIFIVL